MLGRFQCLIKYQWYRQYCTDYERIANSNSSRSVNGSNTTRNIVHAHSIVIMAVNFHVVTYISQVYVATHFMSKSNNQLILHQ